MGNKAEEERALSGPPDEPADSDSTRQNAGGAAEANRCRGGRRLVGLRCVVALLLSAAVALSAVFWLPPFLQNVDRRDLDLDSPFRGHDIVATFKVKKPLSLLEDNVSQLVTDILDEVAVDTTKVVIVSLKPSGGPNITEVIFAVDCAIKNSELSATAQSLIRANFESLVIRQSYLRLTISLFGYPFLFEVLKFPGGFTVSPQQSAFLLQKVQILFSFTLNFSIYQIQENFNELTTQLKLGLHLASYENLYIKLTNLKGSTIAPPTTVESSVVLAVGKTPSTRRLKQLAQTITGSHSGNLGLNNSVFGKVKQVRLSSILKHSLNGGNYPPGPSPAPFPNSRHKAHNHHNDAHFAPAITPVPAPGTEKSAPAPTIFSPSPKEGSPTPQKSYGASPPAGNTRQKAHHFAPAATPMKSRHRSARLPHHRAHPTSAFSHRTPAFAPSPSVAFAHSQPPSNRGEDVAVPPGVRTTAPPLPSSTGIPKRQWALPLLALGLCLLQQK